jgi:hypothetical protein
LLTIGSDTILTSFPSGSYSAPPTDVQDLYQSIIESLARDPKEMKSVADMYLFLTRKVVGYMFSQANRNLVDLVEIYRWVTSKKVNATGFMSCKTLQCRLIAVTGCYSDILFSGVSTRLR